jgi:hypothetical protein
MVTTLGSKGYIPTTTGAYVTVLTVPDGYHCKLNYFFGAASGAVTVDARWSDGADYRFLKGKNLSAGDIVEFGGDGKYLILTEGTLLTFSVVQSTLRSSSPTNSTLHPRAQ